MAAAIRTVAAAFEASHNNVKAAVALDLSFQAIEQITFELGNFPATQACHVNVIALRTPFVEVLFALHMHQVEFVNQAMALEQAEGAINGDAINPWIKLACLAQDLTGIKMLLCGFHHT